MGVSLHFGPKEFPYWGDRDTICFLGPCRPFPYCDPAPLNLSAPFLCLQSPSSPARPAGPMAAAGYGWGKPRLRDTESLTQGQQLGSRSAGGSGVPASPPPAVAQSLSRRVRGQTGLPAAVQAPTSPHPRREGGGGRGRHQRCPGRRLGGGRAFSARLTRTRPGPKARCGPHA